MNPKTEGLFDVFADFGRFSRGKLVCITDEEQAARTCEGTC